VNAPVEAVTEPSGAAKSSTLGPILRGLVRHRTLAALVVVSIVCTAYGLNGDATALITLDNALILVLFSVATNLLLGYGGMASFGQACFFGLGAYLVALGWANLHAPFWLMLVAAPAVGALVATAVGAVALRLQQWFFSLVTLAFSQLFYTIVEKAYVITQGDNGVFGPMIPRALTEPITGFEFVLGVTAICLVLLLAVVRSPFGLTLTAIRDNRRRVQTLGINVYRHQVLAFAISGAFCSVAGALFTVPNQAAYPQLFDWNQSGLPVIASVLGGVFLFEGPVLGAFILQYGRDLLIQHTSHWQLAFGLLLLAIVLLAPDGLLGAAYRLIGRSARRFLSSGVWRRAGWR